MTDENRSPARFDRVLEGEIALVTGGGRGNGKAIADGLACAGATVIVTDVDVESAEATANQIVTAGGHARAYGLDVSDSAACATLAGHITADVGHVSVLVNNAGILLYGRVDASGARERWDRTHRVNIDGPYNVTTAFLDSLKQRNGCVVNVGSIQSFVGGTGAAAYIASKGAVVQLTKALAVELARYGIRVNAIAPGIINTAMTVSVQEDKERLDKILAHVPLRRVGRPDELSGAVVFLASRYASYVTGAVIPIDGGYLAL
ncbi:MAG: SDR family NAD(P)-dependent oxidoreductase [Xanthobacteraceae bacterium]|jgi:NAD(P)-dependent dehydrogenase (short-subunit alcohol dehydrogenase family)